MNNGRMHDVTIHDDGRDRNRRCADMTEVERLESELRHAHRLEALGQMVGGVAHDFNNILTVILGATENVRASLTPADMLHEDVDEIHKAAMAGSGLAQQLMEFSRPQAATVRRVELNALVRNVERMLRFLVGRRAELRLTLASDVSPVFADSSQIEQVLLNLVVNARDAIPSVRYGIIEIETSNRFVDEAYAAAHDGVESGQYVVLAVADSGVGMDQATRSHMFEPYFTTKEPGKGTGLGLSTVDGIVRESGGYVTVQTEPGVGTKVEVYLPRMRAA